MRIALLAALFVVACGSKNDDKGAGSSQANSFIAPKPHDAVEGAAMYRIDVEEITYQRLDDKDQPTGDAVKVSPQRGGEIRCRIEKDPGNSGITTYFTRSIAETGGFIDPEGKDKAADPEVINCVVSSVINTKFDGGPGRYKVTAKAWFSSPKKQ
ncbi:MAG: hypothetical protein HOW73_51060 [Polyangiaceae bacterium]|nr:hypothetical protein [Polyangiaceae bacterium]